MSVRILPYELYKYSPDLSLCALRKEFGMYDYCLNKKKNNKAMNPFLTKGRNYFNLSIFLWIKEMKKRKNYINSFHLFYAYNNKYKKIDTDIFLILECCIQWQIKKFFPYKNNLSWYNIFIEILKSRFDIINKFDEQIYIELLNWYKMNFIRKNKQGQLKPYKLNMEIVIKYFKNILKIQN